MYLIKNVTIFDGTSLQANKNVFICQGKIKNITEDNLTKEMPEFEIDGGGNILAPGFIDIQVNGGGGAFFNADPCVKTLQTICQTHVQFGTTSFLPTFISDTFNNTKQALLAVKQAMQQSLPGVLGIHLEGPYLNPMKKGIHSTKYIRPPLKQEIDEICEFTLPLKFITIAPEMFSQALIEQLIQNNIIVFAGHTSATFIEIQQAFRNGVSGITHFFNACSAFSSREPGVVGAGLLNDDVWCGIIADGFHVDYNSLKLAFKSKTKSKFILVSDAMSAVGTNLTEFILQEEKIHVQNNKYQDTHGTLAGSSLTLHQALKNVMLHKCASLVEALAMTSTNAAQCLKLDHVKGKILTNYDADLVLLNKDNLDLMKVIQGGEIMK